MNWTITAWQLGKMLLFYILNSVLGNCCLFYVKLLMSILNMQIAPYFCVFYLFKALRTFMLDLYICPSTFRTCQSIWKMSICTYCHRSLRSESSTIRFSFCVFLFYLGFHGARHLSILSNPALKLTRKTRRAYRMLSHEASHFLDFDIWIRDTRGVQCI